MRKWSKSSIGDSDGIGMGTTLKELEQRIGKPFRMVMWGHSLESGALTSYDGGSEREPSEGRIDRDWADSV